MGCSFSLCLSAKLSFYSRPRHLHNAVAWLLLLPNHDILSTRCPKVVSICRHVILGPNHASNKRVYILRCRVSIVLPPAGAAVRYHFLSVLVVCLLVCLSVEVCMCLTVCLCLRLCLRLCLSVSDRSFGVLPVCLRLSICIYTCLHLRSVHLRLSVPVYPFASIYLLIASVYLAASIVYLSICMCLSIASVCLSLPLPLCLSGPVCLSVGLPVYRLVSNHSVCLFVVCLFVASLSMCVSVTTRLSLSVRLPTSWGRQPASLL